MRNQFVAIIAISPAPQNDLLFSKRTCATVPVGNQNVAAMKQKTEVLQGTLALMRQPLPLRPGRRHSGDEALDVAGKIMVPLLGKQIGD